MCSWWKILTLLTKMQNKPLWMALEHYSQLTKNTLHLMIVKMQKLCFKKKRRLNFRCKIKTFTQRCSIFTTFQITGWNVRHLGKILCLGKGFKRKLKLKVIIIRDIQLLVIKSKYISIDGWSWASNYRKLLFIEDFAFKKICSAEQNVFFLMELCWNIQMLGKTCGLGFGHRIKRIFILTSKKK